MTLPRLLAGLTSAALAALLLSLFQIAHLPPRAVAPVFVLAALAAWRTEIGLVALGAVLPICSWVGRGWTDSGLSWPHAVLVAFACGYAAHSAMTKREPADRSLRAAVLTIVAIVIASLAVQLAVYRERFGGAMFVEHLWRILHSDFFIVNLNWPAVTSAAMIVEGVVAFYAAARAVARRPAFARTLCAAIVVGGAAAASLNVWRILSASAHDIAPLAKFVELLRTQRINEHYDDVNAAGSYFMLTLWVALGLTVRQRIWSLAALLLASGLWLTGSRMALLAGLLAAAVPWLLVSSRRVSNRTLLRAVAIVAVLAVAAGAAIALVPERGFQRSPSTAIEVRVGLAQAAMKMVAARPVFGIGIGEFYQRSGEFASAWLVELFPRARNENAHNNFLQVFAELGTVGIIGLLSVLTLAARRTWRLLRSSERPDPLAAGLAAGLAGFVLTWLGGHPLLVAEASGTFWILLGVMTGLGPAATPAPAPRWLSLERLVTALVIVLVITIPVRAHYQLADTDLEHVGIGLSVWHRTDENQAYRNAGINSSVFVPTQTAGINVPLRAAAPSTSSGQARSTGSGQAPGEPLEVEVRLDGRLANIVRVDADRWTNVRLPVPAASNPPRFRRLDLHVTNRPAAPAGEVVLLVGKVIAY